MWRGGESRKGGYGDLCGGRVVTAAGDDSKATSLPAPAAHTGTPAVRAVSHHTGGPLWAAAAAGDTRTASCSKEKHYTSISWWGIRRRPAGELLPIMSGDKEGTVNPPSTA